MNLTLQKYLHVCFYLLASITFFASTPTIAQNSSSNLGELFSANTEEFLHVDEAYELMVRQTEKNVVAEWVIADKYFLYGEQFHITANGETLTFSKPEGEVSYDPIFEKDVEKHYTYIALDIEAAQLPEDQNTTLAIRYQGCADAGLCYPPETKYFEVSESGISKIEPPKTQRAKQASANTQSTSWVTLFVMLCTAVIGGIILNLMPCVFPVLSIKALSLASHHDSSSRISHGWAYTLGCVVTFVIIAIVLLITREAGNAVGWGFQLQSPAVITFLTLLFFIMGLSLSGLIEFGGSLMGVGQQLTQGTQKKHSFFTGALATIVASPCTAPFMATALGYALGQPAIIALIIFAGLGFGMALPFLLLSYLPQLQKHLPQPGAWMETFKQALAFPLYLTSVWLIWVLGQQVGNFAIALVLVTAIIVAFLFWLKTKKPQWGKAVYGALLVLLIGILWHNQQLSTQENQSSQHWQPYSAETLANLRANGEPIFVNLTADWCITCKFNEKLVFTDSTLTFMQNKGIHLLEGDWTNYNTEITALLEEYGRGGVPLYLLFPAKPNAEGIILPQILNPTTFKERIESL